eukprot:m.265082 g.265082  ORF g.265082 m.265082 type:complete len:66 (+) comp16030_c0_seq5:469-666(+)
MLTLKSTPRSHATHCHVPGGAGGGGGDGGPGNTGHDDVGLVQALQACTDGYFTAELYGGNHHLDG